MSLTEGFDPSKNLPFVDQVMPDGSIERRYLASLPTPDDHPMRALPGWEAATGIKPFSRADFPQRVFERRHTTVPIIDQNGVGACVAYAHATAVMLLRARSGAPFKLLSAPFLYTLINGGRDAGATAGDAISVLTKTGICVDELVQGRPIRPAGVNQAAMTGASRFKLRDAILLKEIEEVVTAVAFGWQITFDVQAGGAYNTDANGTVRYLGRWTNHEQTAGEGLRLDSRGRIEILGRNSWGTSWGMGGFAWFTEDHMTASNTIYATRYMFEDPEDASIPPPVAA